MNIYKLLDLFEKSKDMHKICIVSNIESTQTFMWNKRLRFRFNSFVYPESHLSIHGQAGFMKQCNMNNDFIVVTGSPWIISDFKREEVFILESDDSVTKPEFQTFGASVNKITMGLLNRRETIGDLSLSELTKYRIQMENDSGADFELLIDEINKNLGDSIEKTLLINMLLDKLDKKGDV